MLVQEQVLGLYVAVSNTQLAQVLDSGDQLLEKPASLVFLEVVLGCDVVEQLAVAAVLHDEKQPVFGLDDFVELDDVGVAHDAQDVDFASHALDVIDVVNFPLVEDFDGHFLPGENVVSLLHFTKGSLA